MEELIINNTGEIHLNLTGATLEDNVASALLGEHYLPFIDNETNTSFLIKFVDSNGSFCLDPNQLVGLTTFDQGGEVVDGTNNLTFQMVPVQQTSTEASSSPQFQFSKEIVEPVLRDMAARMSQAQASSSSSSVITSSARSVCTTQQTASKVVSVQIPKKTSKGRPRIAGNIKKRGAKAITPNANSSLKQQIIPTSGVALSNLTANRTPSGEFLRHSPAQPSNREPSTNEHGVHTNATLTICENSRSEGQFRCTVCDKQFLKWPAFRKHKFTHLDEKLYHCELCPTSFNVESNLELHLMVHQAEVSGCLQCPVCSIKLSRLASLKSHLRAHEKEENLLCMECGDEFPTKGRLDAHLEEHRTRTQQCMLHRCKLCGKSFTQAALLRDHSKEHTAVKKELKVLTARKRKAKHGTSLGQEVIEETIKKRKERRKKVLRACHVCGKQFQKPSQLHRHIRIHTGEKPFTCNQCGRSFNQKGTLDSHVQATHEKVKPFVCHLCSCKFSQRGNLKAHILKVHVPPGENESAFRCLECSCVYRRLATLNSHIAKVHAVHSYPRGLISASKNAPKLVPVSSRNSTTFTEEASEEEMSVEPARSKHSFVTGAPNVKVKSSKRVQNSQEKGGDHDSEMHSQNVESLSEVKLIHNSQGKSGYIIVKIKKVGDIKWHLCPNCSKAFRKPSDLIRHIRVHTQEKPFKCHLCEKAFAVNSTLKQHLRTHTTVKDLECKTCNRKFSLLSSLKAHERLHTGAKPFTCLTCGKTFRTSTQRRIHFKTHTKNPMSLPVKRKLLRLGENEPVLPDPLKITENGLVPVPNRSINTFGPTLPTDGKPRNYKCKMCPKSFKKSSHLKQHIRSHTGERPYQCFRCHRSFVSSGVLKNHIRTHEGVRAYQCCNCKLSFTTNGSLTRHLATHSSARNFMCPYCEKKFKTSVACRKHIKTHRQEILAVNNSSVTARNVEGTENGSLDNAYIQLMDGADNIHTDFSQSINFTDEDFLNGLGFDDIQTGNDLTGIEIQGSSVQQVAEPTVSSVISNSNASVLITESSNATQSHLINSSNSAMQQHQTADEFVTFQYTIANEENTTKSSNIFELDSNSYANQQKSSSMPAVPTRQSHVQVITQQVHPSTAKISVTGTSDTFNHQLFDCYSQPQVQAVNNTSQINPAQRGHELTTSFRENGNSPSQIPIGNAQRNFVKSPSQSSGVSQHQPCRTIVPSSRNVSADLPSAPSSSIPKIATPVASMSKAVLSTSCTAPPPPPQFAPSETADVEKIRESSRPISVKIYNELKEQEEKTRSKKEHTSDNLSVNVKWNHCQFCNRAFKKRSDLQRHLRIHTGEKPFKCHICSKSFRVKSTREVHMRVHTGGKSVSCHVCNNLFATKSSLRVHMRLHTNSKPYKCPHPNCDRWFRTSGHRKAHIQSHFKVKKKQVPETLKKNIKSENKRTTSKANNPITAVTNMTSSSANGISSRSPISPLEVPPSVHVLQNRNPVHSTTVESQPVQQLSNISTSIVTNSTLPSAATENVRSVNSIMQELIPENPASIILNNVQLAIDGPTIQITGIDLNSFQLDENLLQNFTIFIPPSDLVGLGGNVITSNANANNNVVLGMVPPQSQTTTVTSNISSTHDMMNTTNTIELTREQLNLLTSVQTNQHTPTFSLINDLNMGLLSSLPSTATIEASTPTTANNGTGNNDLNLTNQISQYVINNNAMMSSAAVSSSLSKPRIDQLANSTCPLTNTMPNTGNNKCAHCSKLFSKPSLLARHARIHTGEKPFRCKICRKDFSQKSSLISHSYVHTNEKPFACPQCTFKTVQKAALRKHFVKAHPEIPFPEHKIKPSLAAQLILEELTPQLEKSKIPPSKSKILGM